MFKVCGHFSLSDDQSGVRDHWKPLRNIWTKPKSRERNKALEKSVEIQKNSGSNLKAESPGVIHTCTVFTNF